MGTCGTWPPRLVTVPGLHGSEGAHWQSWLERQYAHALRIEQDDWDAQHLQTWAQRVQEQLARERGPFVLVAHSYGCLAAAHALTVGAAAGALASDVAGVLLVAPANPRKFLYAGGFETRRLTVPSIVVGSETDPWMALDDARAFAHGLGSAFVNLGAAGHINTAAGYGPWPRAKYFTDTLVRCAAPLRLRGAADAEMGTAGLGTAGSGTAGLGTAGLDVIGAAARSVSATDLGPGGEALTAFV